MTTTPSQARTVVGDAGGGTSPARGEKIHNFVREQAFENCLELGFAHGVGSVYIASALEANGRGHLASVDIPSALERQPLASDLLDRAGLSHRVSLVIEPTSYTWFLHRMLRERLRESTIEPLFDFVFVDGAHTWDVDGFAFLLVDKLLKPGGWILFDDLHWKLDAERWPETPEAERSIAQVGEVWDLLVIPHAGYDEMRTDASWGWAHKAARPESQTRVVTKTAPLLAQLRDATELVRGRLHRRTG
jgi:predicted O-methyltransferase YrrM